MQDFLLLIIIFAFFSCGTSVQGAGSRLAFSYARDGALPGLRLDREGATSGSGRRSTRSSSARVISSLFVLLVFSSPTHNVHIGFITYPANLNALVSLVSFGVSGIYLSFLLTVIAAIVARCARVGPGGQLPARQVGLDGVHHRRCLYLGLMLVNVVVPTGLRAAHGRYFNLDWITLLVMFDHRVVGAIYFLIARPDSAVGRTCTTSSSRPAPSARAPSRTRIGRPASAGLPIRTRYRSRGACDRRP